MNASYMAVSTTAGDTALTRTFAEASSIARCWVKKWRPALGGLP